MAFCASSGFSIVAPTVAAPDTKRRRVGAVPAAVTATAVVPQLANTTLNASSEISFVDADMRDSHTQLPLSHPETLVAHKLASSTIRSAPLKSAAGTKRTAGGVPTTTTTTRPLEIIEAVAGTRHPNLSQSKLKTAAPKFSTTKRRGRVSYGSYDDLYCSSPEASEDANVGRRNLMVCQPVHLAWRESEKKIPSRHWLLTFDDPNLDAMRLSCVESIFHYVGRRQLGVTTLHLAAHYLNRLFHYFAFEQHVNLVHHGFEFLAVAAGVALRTAVKMQEQLHHVDPFRSKPGHIWHAFHANGQARVNFNSKETATLLNQMERLHLAILEKEAMLNVPVASDYLDQYLKVGGWPTALAEGYRSLANFVLARCLFLLGKKNVLKGTVPSKLAAGAVILSVKIINGNYNNESYEFWPKKLEIFTEYTLEDLQPVVQALSRMLRYSQTTTQSELLGKLFPEWAGYSWC